MMEEVSLTQARGDPPVLGVNLAGYLDALLGIGEVSRRVREALDATGVPVSIQPLAADRSPVLAGARSAREPAGHPVNLICVNAEGMEGAHAALGDAWFSGRYTIGFWWWEAGAFPKRWTRAFDLVDELWVGSHYVADALAPVSPAPVLRMPVPLPAPAPAASVDRRAFGLPDAGPLFLTAFDHASVTARKNPLGVIRAFREAFPSADRAALLVKSVGAAGHPVEARELTAAAAGDERVRIFDGELPPSEMAVLLAGCDCFVSLHRSEGFGLPLAEAMLAGRPAIATAYGGPRDFLHPANAFLVDHQLVRIGPGNDPYPADGWWAEPDIEHAARRMREVVSDPTEAACRGERARAELEASHSLEVSGRAMGARIAFVTGLAPGAAAAPAPRPPPSCCGACAPDPRRRLPPGSPRCDARCAMLCCG